MMTLAIAGFYTTQLWAEPVVFASLQDMSLDLYTGLIALHAVAGVVSFVTGVQSIRPGDAWRVRWFTAYFWTLIAMVVFLAGAMAVAWTSYSSLERIIFPALFGLALYMLYRALTARRLYYRPERNAAFIPHVGFTLISLFEGFVIVALLNADAPGWMIAVVAILGVVVGRHAIHRTESSYTRRAGIDPGGAVP